MGGGRGEEEGGGSGGGRGGRQFVEYGCKQRRGERGVLQGKSYLCIPFLGIAPPQSQFPHSRHIFPCSRIGRPILEI